MVTWTLLTLIAQAVSQPPDRPPVPPQMSCRMIAANGTLLGFDLATRQPGREMQARLIPIAGSVWPAAATDYLSPTPDSRHFTRYRVGVGAETTVLVLGPTYPNRTSPQVQLFEARGDGTGLLLAHGYCSNSPSSPIAQPAVASDATFADPTSWPDHCFVLARDGRRSTFRYRQEDSGRTAVIEPLDENLWPRSRMTASRLSPPSPPAQNGIHFGFATAHNETPSQEISFAEWYFIDTQSARGTISFNFERLSSDPPGAANEGYGLCGLRDLRRRS